MAFTQGKGMAKRRELVDVPAKAKAVVDKSPFYKTWDPRARDALLRHSYVDAKTSESVDLNVHIPKSPIRTSTPRDAEVSLIFRPNFEHVGKDGVEKASVHDRLAVPDVNPAARNIYPFYRAESIGVYQEIEHIRPSVFYVGGDKSAASAPEIRKHRLEHTGTGHGGSGGHKHGRVKEMVVKGGGHNIAMDVYMPQVVQGVGEWLTVEMEVWKDLRAAVESQGEKRSKANPTMAESLLEWTPEGSSIEEIVRSKL